MRVVVCGPRTFRDYELLKRKLTALTKKLKQVVIMHGTARGADQLAERWQMEMWRRSREPANQKKHGTVERYYPDYDAHGSPAALFVRNEEMARKCEAVIAFWDGKSNGTEDMIRRARKHKRVVKVIMY